MIDDERKPLYNKGMKRVTKEGVERAFNKYQRALEYAWNWRIGNPGSEEAQKAALKLARAEDEWLRLNRKFRNQ